MISIYVKFHLIVVYIAFLEGKKNFQLVQHHWRLTFVRELAYIQLKKKSPKCYMALNERKDGSLTQPLPAERGGE